MPDFQVFCDFIFMNDPSIWLTWTNLHARYACCHIIIIIITSTSDLQPSTPTANQLPSQLVSTEIRTMHKNKF